VENHQEYNARAFEKHGASVVILEKDLDEDMLYRKIRELISDKALLDLMSKNAKKIGVADAAEKICAAALELTGRKA
jgi:UDP-N-acetylglucosamine--N-acetylmuramyl-(pentapeptide) pyrophosphoryl-undecaprenol N-acetylglucosamine transferase